MGSGDLVLFPLGGITLALYPKNELAKDIGLDFEPSSFAGLTFSYNTGSKEEVDWVMEKVASLGAQIVKPAQNAFWGGYGGYFKDPDRYYLIEVAFNPFWEFDEDGHLRL
jgi:predicted enzyme related to lactoylglutathione lyase